MTSIHDTGFRFQIQELFNDVPKLIPFDVSLQVYLGPRLHTYAPGSVQTTGQICCDRRGRGQNETVSATRT
jgi:hypothetical protein